MALVEILPPVNLYERRYRDTDTGVITSQIYGQPVYYEELGVLKSVEQFSLQTTATEVKSESDAFKFSIKSLLAKLDTTRSGGGKYEIEVLGLYVDNTLIQLPLHSTHTYATATDIFYEDIFDGVDLKITIGPYKYSETIILKENPLLNKPIGGEKLYVKFRIKGALTFKSPFAKDANDRVFEPYMEQVSSIEVRKGLPTRALYTYSYPIEIDPTTSPNPSSDALVEYNPYTPGYVRADSTDLSINYYEVLDCGMSTGYWATTRSYLRFNLSSLSAVVIDSATFNIYQLAHSGNSAYLKGVGAGSEVDPETGTISTIWANANGATSLGTITSALNSWRPAVNATSFVETHKGGFADFGMTPVGGGQNTYGSSEGTNKPYLSITYHYVYTSSHTLDATVAVSSGNTYTEDHTLDCSVKATTTRTHTIDATIRETFTKTHTLDSTLKEVNNATNTLDTSVKASYTSTNTLYSIVEETFVSACTLDATVKETLTKTQTNDSIVKEILSKTHTLDSIVRVTETKTKLLDSVVRTTSVAESTVDASVLVTTEIEYSLDNILRYTETESSTLDLVLVERYTTAFTLDTNVITTNHPTSYSIDVGTLVTGNLMSLIETDSNELQVQETAGTPGTIVRFIFKNAGNHAHLLYVFGRYQGNVGHVVKLQQYNYTTATWVNVTADTRDFLSEPTDSAHTFTLLAGSDYLGPDGTSLEVRFNHTSPGSTLHNLYFDEVLLINGEQHLLDAVVRTTEVSTHTLDGVVKSIETEAHELDAAVKATYYSTSELDTVVRVTESETHEVDSLVKEINTETTDVDASIRASYTSTSTVDAIVSQSGIQTHGLDSSLKAYYTVASTVDTAVAERTVKSCTLDAVVAIDYEEKTIEHGIDYILRHALFYGTWQVSDNHYSTLPNRNLSNPFNESDYTNVYTENTVYQNTTGTGQYLYTMIRYRVGEIDEVSFYWNIKSSVPATESNPITLLVWNHTIPGWEIKDYEYAESDTEVTLSAVLNTDYVNAAGNMTLLAIHKGVR